MSIFRIAVALGVGASLASTPSAVAYVRHDLVAGEELEGLARRLPERTVVLDTALDVGRADGECRVMVAKVLGTELGVGQVAAFVAAQEPAHVEATSVAWAEPGAFRHRRLTASMAAPVPLPAAVERQLSRWMAIPPGVRRVVLYRTRPLDAEADPRCW